MKVSEEEIREYIKNHYAEKHTEFHITERILSRLTPIIIEGLEKAPQSISMERADPSIEAFLEKNNILEFVREKQPNTQPIPEQVIHSLNAYFEEHLSGYEICHVYRKSNYQEDGQVYSVTARNGKGEYACWSSWNAVVGSLNQGHYNLPTEADGIHILLDLFNDVTDEPERFGMLHICYEAPMEKCEQTEVQQEKNNIIEYPKHRHSL